MKKGTVLTRPGIKSTVKTGRTLVIGDIHGNFKALQEVLEKCNYSPDDVLIVLGDLVDGYPEATPVIEMFIDLSISRQIIFIKGNHDIWLESYLTTGIALDEWMLQGGAVTKKNVDAYLSNFPKRWEPIVKFLRAMHLYYVDDQNRVFVHGGFDPKYSLSDNKSIHGEQIFYWDRTLVENAHKRYYDKNRVVRFTPTNESFTDIFVGHTSTELYNSTRPLNYGNVWVLDTGAGYKGKLTVMDVNTKEYWQSQIASNYYSYAKK